VFAQSPVDIDIDNSGFLSADSLFAIDTVGAGTSVVNTGQIVGFIDLTDNADNVENLDDGLFDARLTSDFRGGADVFNNSGTLRTAVDPAVLEAVAFINLETFNNGSLTGGPGLITMVDGQAGDSFTLGDGDDNLAYTGQGSSTLAVDSFLASAPDGLSDMLIINGTTDGFTNVVVNNTNPNGSSPNLGGIPVVIVDGTTADGHFDLDGAPISAGLFAWDLFLDDTTHELRTIGPSALPFEFAAQVGAAHNIWHQTAGVWLERQPDLRLAFHPAAAPADVIFKPAAAMAGEGVTPGVWVRGIGSWSDRDSSASFTNLQTGAKETLDLDHGQDIGGVMGGFDGRFERADHAWLLGLLGGYIWSDVEFVATDSEWEYEGPTVGAYATYVDRALYVDMLVKADFLDIEFDTTAFGPGGDGDSDVVNLGGRIDTGYKFDVGNGVFVEPQGTLAYVHSDFDDVSVFGGTVSSDGESLRGRVGLRAGKDWQFDVVNVGMDATASVWHEFLDDNEATVKGFVTPNFTASVSEVDTYGEVGGGLTFVGTDGWSGFARGKYQFADKLSAGTVNAGLRYTW
jgi:outer membrane autotransporter protein